MNNDESPYKFNVLEYGSHPVVAMNVGPSFLRIYNTEGGELVSINMITGEVILAGDPNEAAKQFWKAVELMFPYNHKE